MNATISDVKKAPNFLMTCFARTEPNGSAAAISSGPDSYCFHLPLTIPRYLSAYAYLDLQHSACDNFGVRRGSFRGFSGQARTRGWPSSSRDEIGFIGVDNCLSIVVRDESVADYH